MKKNPKKPKGDAIIRPIYTERLLLRPYVPDDWKQVHVYASIPEFSQFDVWGPNSIEDTKRFVTDCIVKASENPIQRYEFAVVLKDGSHLIGGCTLKRNASAPGQAGIGYAINPEYQNSGYATEAAVALIRFAFQEPGLSLVYAQCDTRNEASRRVMEKAGMKLATVLRNHQEIRGVMTDSYRYEILLEQLRAFIHANSTSKVKLDGTITCANCDTE